MSTVGRKPPFETNEPGKGWDGSLNGTTQPMGVYVYVVKALSLTGG